MASARPPGKTSFYKWLAFAPLGLALMGAGLSMAVDAGTLKAAGKAWFWYGTGALAVFNAGAVLLAESVKCRLDHEREERERKAAD